MTTDHHSMNKRFAGLMPFVVDIETSGTNYRTDAMLELSIVQLAFKDNQLITEETCSCHILPFEGARIDPKALEINGIDPWHPFRLALEEKKALKKAFDFVQSHINKQQCKRAVLVGHNAHFDLYFLEAATKRCGLKSPFHAFTVFDTATLGGVFFGQTVLAKAIKQSGKHYDKNEAHSAIYDAKITADLFCDIINSISIT